jgi:hypothetical protein
MESSRKISSCGIQPPRVTYRLARWAVRWVSDWRCAGSEGREDWACAGALLKLPAILRYHDASQMAEKKRVYVRSIRDPEIQLEWLRHVSE